VNTLPALTSSESHSFGRQKAAIFHKDEKLPHLIHYLLIIKP